jgi:plasmid maintenance system killer protein
VSLLVLRRVTESLPPLPSVTSGGHVQNCSPKAGRLRPVYLLGIQTERLTRFEFGVLYILVNRRYKLLFNMKNGVFGDVTPCGSCRFLQDGQAAARFPTGHLNLERLQRFEFGGLYILINRRYRLLFNMNNGVFGDVTPCGSCRFLQEPHGVTSQKTPFFIVTAVKTSNLTCFST